MDSEQVNKELAIIVDNATALYPEAYTRDQNFQPHNWVKAAMNAALALGRELERIDAVQRRHEDNMALHEKSIAATMQGNEMTAALNAQINERQEARDKRWEELCMAQNDSLAGIKAVLDDMFTHQLNRPR